jgi:hypothetical protein
MANYVNKELSDSTVKQQPINYLTYKVTTENTDLVSRYQIIYVPKKTIWSKPTSRKFNLNKPFVRVTGTTIPNARLQTRS